MLFFKKSKMLPFSFSCGERESVDGDVRPICSPKAHMVIHMLLWVSAPSMSGSIVKSSSRQSHPINVHTHLFICFTNINHCATKLHTSVSVSA